MPGFVGRVDGISVSMDINACYRDYPEIIRTNLLNGWIGFQSISRRPKASGLTDISGTDIIKTKRRCRQTVSPYKLRYDR